MRAVVISSSLLLLLLFLRAACTRDGLYEYVLGLPVRLYVYNEY